MSVRLSVWRSLQTLNISRVVVALILLVYASLWTGRDQWQFGSLILRLMAGGYFLCACAFVVVKLRWTTHFLLQLVVQISVDLLLVSALYVGAGGIKSGLVILYLFPLAGAGILAPLLWSLFFVSAVSLFLLLVNIFQILQNEEGSSLSQAGLYGAAYFTVVLILNHLAKRLIGQEELASQRGAQLALQQAINRTVIADMDGGVLVVDQEGRLFESNPAAERILGAGVLSSHTRERLRLRQIPWLEPIAEALDHWRAGLSPNTTTWLQNEGASFVVIRHFVDSHATHQFSGADAPYEAVTHLKLRFVLIDDEQLPSQTSPCTLIFMQNVSDIENQAQQLKLASMGRLTASIAHEVRNPLSSISYASSLLSEDVAAKVLNEAQAMRLFKIVDDNVARLNQLIEDILKLSRKAQHHVAPFLLMDQLKEIVQEFVETRAISPQQIQLTDTGQFLVSFDLGHLHEVITNLLSNALRYASGAPGSIRLIIRFSSGNRRELHIQDDGPGISALVRAHLFEPFYTTSSKGTGLGLYMARELCLNNHALLDYEHRNDESSQRGIGPGGRFVINFSSVES
ncbi:MAG: PAS domain-containing sensor histidine kinase [Undibacterium sp.]|nr:PAS domain-containing sensor histidine kinase [Undibacterium sp.]